MALEPYPDKILGRKTDRFHINFISMYVSHTAYEKVTVGHGNSLALLKAKSTLLG